MVAYRHPFHQTMEAERKWIINNTFKTDCPILTYGYRTAKISIIIGLHLNHYLQNHKATHVRNYVIYQQKRGKHDLISSKSHNMSYLHS